MRQSARASGPALTGGEQTWLETVRVLPPQLMLAIVSTSKSKFRQKDIGLKTKARHPGAEKIVASIANGILSDAGKVSILTEPL